MGRVRRYGGTNQQEALCRNADGPFVRIEDYRAAVRERQSARKALREARAQLDEVTNQRDEAETNLAKVIQQASNTKSTYGVEIRTVERERDMLRSDMARMQIALDAQLDEAQSVIRSATIDLGTWTFAYFGPGYGPSGVEPHSGPGWYGWATEYTEEGSMGAFDTLADCIAATDARRGEEDGGG